MCGTCGHKGGCCFWHGTAKALLIIGGLNWGLVGVGMLTLNNWNIVNMLLGSMPTVEAIIYILVGVAALVKLIGCRCKKCTTCDVSPATTSIPGNM